MGFLPAQESRP